MNVEIWKDLGYLGYENYLISNYGNIKHRYKGNFLKPTLNTRGYYVVSLSKNGIVKKVKIHRLVAYSFCKGDNKLVVNHIDGNQLNNYYLNLEWVTQSYNLEHAFNIGKTPKYKKKVKCIELNIIFNSSYDASKVLNLSQGAISNVCSGVRKTSGNYHFEWVKNK